MRALLLAASMLALLSFLALSATADPGIGPGEPQCMYYYHETHIGPVTIINRDSCHSEYYLCGRSVGDALANEHPLDCMVVS
jgi:hypothetical protein